MNKLKGILLLTVIMVIIALPFFTFVGGYNGSVSVENNLNFEERKMLLNLDNANVQEDKIKLYDQESELLEDNDNYVYEIVKNEIPLGTVNNDIVVNELKEEKISYISNDENNVVRTISNDEKNIDTNENDINMIADAKANKTEGENSDYGTINEDAAYDFFYDYKSQIVSLDELDKVAQEFELEDKIAMTIIDSNEVTLALVSASEERNYEEIITNSEVPLANLYTSCDYPKWILGEDTSANIIIDSMENTQIENEYYNVDTNVIVDDLEVEVENIENEEDAIIVLVSDGNKTTDVLYKSVFDNDVEKRVRMKNQIVRARLIELGLNSALDDDSIFDESVPLGLFLNDEELADEVQIKTTEDEEKRFIIYEVPLFFAEYVNDDPIECSTSFYLIN